jgi:dolichol-phosphate mannosyltransferase
LTRRLWVRHRRFLKFGTVGAVGVVVNLAVLTLGKEILFAAIPSPRVSLNLSLALAILVSTLGNFTGNRHWTWLDRRQHHLDKSLLLQFSQYALACWVGIALQVLFTNILVLFLHYLPANLAAIALAGVFNYLVNDAWTFGRKTGAAKGRDGLGP